jgi:hypothetical protein
MGLGRRPPAGVYRSRCAAALSTGLAVVALGGCTSLQSPARDVASRFYASVAAADWSTACTLLAPKTRSELEQSAGKSCPAALKQEGLPKAGSIRSFAGFGRMAQASFAKDTVFLAEFGDGWKVMAADCSPVPGQPFNCRLKGG